jgi:hypothetical protein
VITDDAISRLTNLTDLNIGQTRATPDIPFPEVVRESYHITDRSVSLLTQLRTLGLSSNRNVTNATIWRLTNLTALNLNSNSTVTDEALAGLPNLTSLELYDNSTITLNLLSTLQKLVNYAHWEKLIKERLAGGWQCIKCQYKNSSVLDMCMACGAYKS